MIILNNDDVFITGNLENLLPSISQILDDYDKMQSSILQSLNTEDYNGSVRDAFSRYRAIEVRKNALKEITYALAKMESKLSEY